jgi:hypothetical protein
MPYGNPLALSGNGGFKGFNLSTGPSINTAINDARDWALLHGWTNPASEGTAANADMTVVAVPFRFDGAPASEVPINASSFGGFDGKWFDLYDPGATPPDPDPTGNAGPFGTVVVGVQLGLSAAATLAFFNAALGANTRYTSTISITDPMTGSGTGQIIAKGDGPDYHDPEWAPDSANIAGAPPLGGGWYLYSTPAPDTGDQMRMWIGRPKDFGGPCSFITELSGHLTNKIELRFAKYQASINPYQVAWQMSPGESAVTGSKGFLAACLKVPPEQAPVSISISSVSNASLADVVINTASAHDMEIGQRAWVSGATGAALINGLWWVVDTPSPTSLKISATSGGSALQGDGSAFAGTAVVQYGIFQSAIVTTGLINSPVTSQAEVSLLVNGSFKSSWTVSGPHRSIVPAMLPMINIGTETVDGVTSAGKPVLQPAYVALTFENDAEARIAGLLWDATVELKNRTYDQRMRIQGDVFTAWMEDTRTLRPMNGALWLRAVED